ncbi:MAG TPA: ABC transporter ATP-binding protein [Devosiaceae bacterium]|jgi:oligopeptide transport system ATP-binding protein
MQPIDPILLEVDNLQVEFRTGSGTVRAVNGVSFALSEGETLCIVGESGSGKSITGETIMGILDTPPGFVTAGAIRYRGRDLLTLDEDAVNAIRGRSIAMVFQDALATLNPVLPVGSQIAEMFERHLRMPHARARDAAIAVMEKVQIPAARDRFGNYPHQFSGGMRQRIMIAMAVALEPDVLIADEPTTALDVTVQAGIIQLLGELCAERQMGMILITHDLSVVANVADSVAVMYAGRIVEQSPVEPIFEAPRHPYTIGLMRSLPRVETGVDLATIPGSPPDPRHIPKGCAFHPRCPWARERCAVEVPLLRPAGTQRLAACHFWEEIADVQ